MNIKNYVFNLFVFADVLDQMLDVNPILVMRTLEGLRLRTAAHKYRTARSTELSDQRS